MFDRIDHVGVATEDLDGAVALYEGTFGMPVAHRETIESQGVEAVLLDVGEYLAKKGPGLHHVAYSVPDIDATLGALTEAGVELIDSEAREGIRESRVAFLHPRATGGVLTEIVEPAEAH